MKAITWRRQESQRRSAGSMHRRIHQGRPVSTCLKGLPRFKRGGIVLLLILATACSGSSTAPSTTSVAGNWSGTWQNTQVGGSYIVPLTMNLSQGASSVAGTWSTATANGTVTGATTTSTFSGTFTWNATDFHGVACTGTFPVSGSAGGNTLNWTSPGVTGMTGNCTNLPTSITLAVQSH